MPFASVRAGTRVELIPRGFRANKRALRVWNVTRWPSKGTSAPQPRILQLPLFLPLLFARFSLFLSLSRKPRPWQPFPPNVRSVYLIARRDSCYFYIRLWSRRVLFFAILSAMNREMFPSRDVYFSSRMIDTRAGISRIQFTDSKLQLSKYSLTYNVPSFDIQYTWYLTFKDERKPAT